MHASRHQVVHSLSLSDLQQQVNTLLGEGWTTVGQPTLAQPVDHSCPACWVQALYLHARPGMEFESETTLEKKHTAGWPPAPDQTGQASPAPSLKTSRWG